MKRKKHWSFSGIRNAVSKRIHRRMIYLETKIIPGKGLGVSRFQKKISRDPEGFLFAAWLKLEDSFFIKPLDKDWISTEMGRFFSETREATLANAQLILKHVLDVRGSGEFNHGAQMDWHRDPLSTCRWPSDRFYTSYHPSPPPGGPDITLPWELSRCQHFVTLGQAYWFTEDEAYVDEFAAQVESWLEQNFWPYGVNWAGPMDIAIRAVNWIWAYALMHRSPRLSQAFHLRFYTSLVQHGHHLRRNLERTMRLRTNHYLANLSGLLYLGLLLPESCGARPWAEFALQELNQEIMEQIYPDGASFEASTSYHRLSTEMLVSCRLLARKNGLDFNACAIERLEKALEFILHMTRADGTVSLIGDHDNGRLHRLKVWREPLREWNDFRYLLAVGAVLYARPDFGMAAGDQWEESLWLCGKKALPDMSAARQEKANVLEPARLEGHAFRAGGFYILRREDFHLTLRAGSNGQNGNGGHAHNDKLSCTVQWGQQDWLVDPGCYTYTRDYLARNAFRSTAAHNTVRVDEQEQNPIPTTELFSLPDQAPVSLHLFQVSDQGGIVDASHAGYERLMPPVTHRRKVFLPVEDDWCLIQDQFSGQGQHRLELFFHVGNNLIHRDHEQLTILEHPENMGLRFGIYQASPSPLEISVEPGWQSPGYGLKAQANVLTMRFMLYLPAEIRTLLCWGDGLKQLETDPDQGWEAVKSRYK